MIKSVYYAATIPDKRLTVSPANGRSGFCPYVPTRNSMWIIDSAPRHVLCFEEEGIYYVLFCLVSQGRSSHGLLI